MNTTVNKANMAPVVAGLTVLIVYACRTFWQVEIPAEVQAAINGVLGWVAVYFIANKEPTA